MAPQVRTPTPRPLFADQSPAFTGFTTELIKSGVENEQRSGLPAAAKRLKGDDGAVMEDEPMTGK